MLLIMTALNLASIAIFIRLGGISSILRSLEGQETLNQEMRMMIESAGDRALWLSFIVMPSMYFPVAYSTMRASPRCSWTRTVFWVFSATYLLAAVLGSRRNAIARPLFGLLLCYVVWGARRSMTLSRALLATGGAAASLLLVFVSLSSLRNGISGTEESIREVGRYLLTPFNSDGLVINDEMDFPGSGRGYLWTQWIWNFPILDDVFELQEVRASLLGEAVPYGAVDRGDILHDFGVSGSTNLSSFSSSYIDFRWLGVIPFFIVGWLTGDLWLRFQRQTLGGLIFYPIAAYSFLEFRANIGFPGPTFGYALTLFVAVLFCRRLERGPA
jgi:hypothetical protein